MDKETVMQALRQKLKEDMDLPENVHYNEGIIDAIQEIEKLDALHKLQKPV